MKIAQFYDKNRIRLGIIDADSLIPLDFQGEMIDFIKKGSDCKSSGKSIPMDRIKLAPPVSNPSKIVAIGLNYMDHILESKGEIPKFPLIFAKFPNSLIGHNDCITWDVNLTKKVDFVGTFRNPSIYMKDGNEVVVEIEKAGRLVNTYRAI